METYHHGMSIIECTHYPHPSVELYLRLWYLRVRRGGTWLGSPCRARSRRQCRHTRRSTWSPWGSRRTPSTTAAGRSGSRVGRPSSPAVSGGRTERIGEGRRRERERKAENEDGKIKALIEDTNEIETVGGDGGCDIHKAFPEKDGLFFFFWRARNMQ